MKNFSLLPQNKFWTYIYVLQSVLCTARYSIITIYQALLGRCSRTVADHIVRRWANRLLTIARAKINCVGKEKLHFQPQRRYILMCNHTSLYDIPLIFAAIPGSIRMLTKKELFRVPIWGSAMRQAEFVSIDRHKRERAIADLKLARQKMESGIILWVAPEGTRSAGDRLLPLKKGPFMLALETQAIIIPIGLRGASDILPKRSHRLNLNVTVDIHIGDPIDTSSYSLENRDELIGQVENALTNLAGYHER